MSLYEAYSAADSALDWKSEVTARIHDFLSRKVVGPVSEKLEAARRAAEGSLSMSRVKSRLRTLTASMLRRAGSPPTVAVNPEVDALFLRIREHGRGRTIEDYSSYLVSVEIDF